MPPLSRLAATSLLYSPFLQPRFLQRRKSVSGCVHSSALSSQASTSCHCSAQPSSDRRIGRTALVLPPPASLLLGAVWVFQGHCALFLCTSCSR